MQKTLLSIAIFAAFTGLAAASTQPSGAIVQPDRTISVPRQGGDDPIGDDRGNDGGGHKRMLAKDGADDPFRDGCDIDGTAHKRMLARDGADDPFGDDHGNDGGGHKGRA